MVVTRGGVPVDLEPKAFDVLRLLIEHRDRLASKDELLDADTGLVWIDAATRRVTPFTLGGGEMADVRLSPGGDAIAFHVIDRNGVLNLWTQPLNGGNRRQITFD